MLRQIVRLHSTALGAATISLLYFCSSADAAPLFTATLLGVTLSDGTTAEGSFSVSLVPGDPAALGDPDVQSSVQLNASAPPNDVLALPYVYTDGFNSNLNLLGFDLSGNPDSAGDNRLIVDISSATAIPPDGTYPLVATYLGNLLSAGSYFEPFVDNPTVYVTYDDLPATGRLVISNSVAPEPSTAAIMSFALLTAVLLNWRSRCQR
jgi:hypothetical protein